MPSQHPASQETPLLRPLPGPSSETPLIPPDLRPGHAAGAVRVIPPKRPSQPPQRILTPRSSTAPITDPRIEEYLTSLFPGGDPVLLQMERLAAEQDLAIAGPLLGRYLRQLAQTLCARDVFEMGAGIGYATFYLAHAVGDGGRVVHTDLDAGKSQLARTLLQQAGLSDRVTFEVGDAVHIVADYPGPFDLIFIDVDSGDILQALTLAQARVRLGGYIVVNQVLCPEQPGQSDQARQAVLRYLKAALAATDLYTTVVPLGQGLALHLKLPEQRRRR